MYNIAKNDNFILFSQIFMLKILTNKIKSLRWKQNEL